MSRQWVEPNPDHPRDPRTGEFTESWAARVSSVVARHTRRRGPGPEDLEATIGDEVVDEGELHGGASARTRWVEYGGGTTVVVKDFDRLWNNEEQKQQLDAEYLAGLVGAAVNAPIPAVLHGGDHVIMGYIDKVLSDPQVDGRNRDLRRQDMPTMEEQARRTDGGILLGLVDVLTYNADRNPGNYLFDQSDSEIIGIDHGWAFDRLDQEQLDAAPEALLANGFTARFIRRVGPGAQWIVNPMSPADMATVGARLQGLRPEFEQHGRSSWHDGMMARYQQIAAHARGSRDRI